MRRLTRQHNVEMTDKNLDRDAEDYLAFRQRVRTEIEWLDSPDGIPDPPGSTHNFHSLQRALVLAEEDIDLRPNVFVPRGSFGRVLVDMRTFVLVYFPEAELGSKDFAPYACWHMDTYGMSHIDVLDKCWLTFPRDQMTINETLDKFPFSDGDFYQFQLRSRMVPIMRFDENQVSIQPDISLRDIKNRLPALVRLIPSIHNMSILHVSTMSWLESWETKEYLVVECKDRR